MAWKKTESGYFRNVHNPDKWLNIEAKAGAWTVILYDDRFDTKKKKYFTTEKEAINYMLKYMKKYPNG